MTTLLNNRYKLGKELGRGAFATVYRAHDRQLNRSVAVKILHPFLLETGNGEAVANQFLREARAMAQISHSHIAHLYEVGRQGSQLFLVMEYLPGGDLAREMAGRGRYSLDETIDRLRPIAAALEMAHAAGAIHRDVKPANILFRADNAPVLTDFGLVKFIQLSLGVTQYQPTQGQSLGTPGYKAPEQINVELGEVGPAADLFALAVVAYQMLSSQPPFPGDSADALNYQTVHADRAKLAQRLPADLPPAVRQALMAALQVQPAARPSALLDWLDGWRPLAQSTSAMGISPITALSSNHQNSSQIELPEKVGNVVQSSQSLDKKTVKSIKGQSLETDFRLIGSADFNDHSLPMYQIVWSPDDKLVALATARGILIFDADKIRLVRFLDNRAIKYAVAFSHDSEYLVSGGGEREHSDPAPSLQLWRVSDGTLLYIFAGHTRRVTGVGFKPDNNSFVSGSYDGTIRIWQAKPAQEVLLINATVFINALTVSPDGQTIAAQSSSGLHLWDARNGAYLRTLRQGYGSVPPVFSPDGSWMASSEGKQIYLWRTDDWSCQNTFNATSGLLFKQTDRVCSLSFSKHNLFLAGLEHRKVQIWRTKNGSQYQTIQNIWNRLVLDGDNVSRQKSFASFSTSGHKLALVTGKRFEIWSADL